jgi:hypothetical protein
MPQVKVGPVVAVPGCNVGVQPGFPFPFLYHHDRIGDQRIAAHMVEMEMGVDYEINSRRVVIDIWRLIEGEKG